MNRVHLVGLLKIALTTGVEINLCDGGFIVYDGDTYQSQDPIFGTISSIQPLSEGVGEEVPALEIALSPNTETSAADLSQPGHQRSQVWLWIAEKDEEAGTIIGEPDLLFFGQIDQTRLRVGRNSRELSMTVVSTLERLFMRNEGNSLSPSFHKSVWPGETGHDNASGLSIAVAWGVESSGGGAFGSYGGGSGGGSGGGVGGGFPEAFER